MPFQSLFEWVETFPSSIALRDPKEPAPVPPPKGLVAKFLVHEAFLLTYSMDTCVGEPKATDVFGFKYQDTRRRRNSSQKVQVGSAATLFPEGPVKDRFYLNKAELFRDKVGGVLRTATIEDRKKAGRLFTIQKGSRNGLLIRDWTATLSFLDPAGKNHEIEVEDGETFVLPGTGRTLTFERVEKVRDFQKLWFRDGEKRFTLPDPK